MLRFTRLLASLSLGIGAAPLSAQSWNQLSPPSQPATRARVQAALAFDAHRNRAVLFGGTVNNVWVADTWEWDGATWVDRTPSDPSMSPPATAYPGLVYDSRHQRVLLYSAVSPNDMWTWDGVAWTRVSVSGSAPPPRGAYAMAYDSSRGVAVLFSGLDGVADTWEWDGTAWTERFSATVPQDRFNHSMAYDSVRKVVVLYGGKRGPFGAAMSDTWEWDGADWIQRLPSTSPPPLQGQVLAYHKGRGTTILFGGFDQFSQLRSDTWEWDGTSWTNIGIGPPGRSTPGMAYSCSRNTILLFGGGLFRQPPVPDLNDTWEFGVPTTGVCDADPPDVVITAPAEGDILGTTSVTLAATVTEEGSTTVASVPAGVFPDALPDGGGQVSGLVSLDAEGDNFLSVWATDDYGNVGASSVTVVRDTTPPVVTVLSPAEGAVLGDALATFTAQVVDLTPTTLTFGGNTASLPAGGSTASGDVPLVAGPNTILFTVTDAAQPAGNVGTAVRNVVVDLDAPVVTIDAPPNNGCFGPGEETVAVVATVTDLTQTSVGSAPPGRVRLAARRWGERDRGRDPVRGSQHDHGGRH